MGPVLFGSLELLGLLVSVSGVSLGTPGSPCCGFGLESDGGAWVSGTGATTGVGSGSRAGG